MKAWLRMGRLLLGIGWDIGPTVFLAYVGVSALGFINPLLLALGLRPLVDGIVFDRPADIVAGTLAIGLALVLGALAPAFYRWGAIRMRERSIMVLQRRLLGLATRAAGLAHFERPDFWDRLQLLKRSSFDLAMGLTLMFLGPLMLIQLVVTAGILASLQPALVLLPVIALPAGWLRQYAEKFRRAADLATAEDRRASQHLFGLAATAAPAMEIRLYGLEDELRNRHRDASQRVHGGIEAALFKATAVTLGSWVLFAATYTGAVILVLGEAAGGNVTPGDVALTLALATALVTAAGRLAELSGSALRSRTASEHYHWLDAQSAAAARDGMVAPPTTLQRGVTFESVSFTYGEAGRPALYDIDLTLPAGAVVAIVGENGAGKTTLVKLLCGMYQPDAGRVTVDGVDLAAIDLDAYRKRVTAGFQDFMRFELVARESVGLGDVPRIGDTLAARTALDQANATFVDRLPAGVETQLGPAWEDGVDLSGGEWQKVALARSLLRTRPLLMVLDEPTASLDPQTEHALFEQVAGDARRGAADGRITVLISHRFSTVRMADVIFVLDGGRLLEHGSHAELMARRGLYAELYELQAEAYR